jgi:hypothetical protein
MSAASSHWILGRSDIVGADVGGTPGQRNDIAFAHELVDGFNAGATIGDKGYDADRLCQEIAETGAEIVIPPKRNRKIQRAYDVESATSSSVSSTSSNSSAGSQRDMTNCLSTSWASSNLPPSPYGSNS